MKKYKSVLVTSSLMRQMANEDFGPFEVFLYHTHMFQEISPMVT